VDGPFQRLIEERQLANFEYDGFWKAMDTFKDKQQFDDIYANGAGPWEIWRQPEALPRSWRIAEPPLRRRRRKRFRPADSADARTAPIAPPESTP